MFENSVPKKLSVMIMKDKLAGSDCSFLEAY